MPRSRTATIALIGLALGTGVVFGGTQGFTLGQPALAQIDPTGNYSIDGNNSTPVNSNGYNYPTQPSVTGGYNDPPQPSVTGKQRSGKLKRNNLLQQLNLTPDQQQRISSVQQQYKGQMRDTRGSLKQARQELKTLQASSSTSSSSSVQAKIQEVKRLRKSLKDLRSRQLMAMRQYLTPSQTQQLMQVMQQNRGEKKSGFRSAPSAEPYNTQPYGQPNSSTY